MIDAMRLITNILAELLIIRAYCKLLDMKSNVVFAIINMSGMALGLALDTLNVNSLVRTAVIAPIVFVVFPIAYSRGPLRSRVLRCTLLAAVLMLVGLASDMMLVLIFGPDAFQPGSTGSSLIIMVSVFASTSLMAVALEAMISFFNRIDRNLDTGVVPSLVALLLWSYGISILGTYFSTDGLYSIDASFSVVSTVYYVLVLLLCTTSIALLRQDYYATRRASDRTALARQSKHMRTEIDAATRQAAITRRLRHERANSSPAIVESAKNGNAEKAHAYLDALRTQAQSVMGNTEGRS